MSTRSPEQYRLPADLGSRATMIAGIVHDLRAPVQVVRGWASLLRRKHDDPARTEHALSIIERSAETLKDLLEALLEQTRPAWMDAPVRRQELDLAELVRSEVRGVEPLADQAGVRVSLSADVPALALEGNEVQLRRVVANLIGNALKFTPRGGSVECRVWGWPQWAGLEVRDNGRGIDRAFLPKIFDAFQQEPSRHSRDGHGLGLHIVRDLVELHGGRVSAASDGPGRGAVFTVLLPVAQDVAGAMAPPLCSGF